MRPIASDWDRVEQASATIRTAWPTAPEFALILGSGLGAIADRLTSPLAIDYATIPHFSRSTAAGHRGRLVCGFLRGRPIIVMQGRLHLYEGYCPTQVALPIRVLRHLGVQTLLVTNASGGLNAAYRRSDIMLIDDQINLMFANPLIGPNDDRWGPRFPDLCNPYDRDGVRLASTIARRLGIAVHEGVYAGVRGPNYETRAEYRMLRWLGADAVGMSTVPEVLAAVHCGMRVFGLSVIANVASPDALPTTTHQEVVDAVEIAALNVAPLLEGLIEEA